VLEKRHRTTPRQVKFKDKGYHTVHAYLYDGDKRIGYKSDTVLVK
jgi:hypothetical protein